MNIIGPSTGRAEVLGIESSKFTCQTFTKIGYVSENQDLPNWMRTGDLLEFLRPFYPTWDRDLERTLIAQFDLPLDRKLKHLSRGMKIKAALASSLAYHPELIVLDEPFTGLDPLVRDELIESLRARARGATILVSSHDLGEVESFSTHVGYLEQGELKFSGELVMLSARYREVELTLEKPPTNLPLATPPNWTQFQATGATIRFIATDFHSERTPSELRQIFGPHASATFTPMSLRSIFLNMARASRDAGKRS